MSLDKLQQLVGSLAKTMENQEQLAIPVLSAKLDRFVNAYPEDKTIGAMARVIEKMAENKTLFIKKADLQDLYRRLHARNTKFAQLFQEELGITETLPTPQLYQRDDTKSDLNPFQVADPVLANALPGIFDHNVPIKMYSEKVANQALQTVNRTLDNWNLKPHQLKVEAGNDQFLVVKADYETPKGLTGFYVPVEVNQNQVIEPSLFMGNQGPQDLNHSNIKGYLTTVAGSKLQITSNDILKTLTSAVSENRTVSETELAIIKLNAMRQGQSEFFSNQIVGQKIAEASEKDLDLPKSDEFASFEEQFTSPSGQAAWHFGKENVKLAREYIVRELTSFGYRNPQINIAKIDSNTIFYSVSLDNGHLGFTVPVKVANGKVKAPNLILCNGSVSGFDQANLHKLYANNDSDFQAVAVASPQFGLKPADLVHNIRQAMLENNHAKAEDALNILANNGDERMYALGFQTFMDGLGGKLATPTESQCSQVIKTSASQHPICAHTGLPVHKVYQDKEGNCRPLYRRDMDPAYEVAALNSSKIFG